MKSASSRSHRQASQTERPNSRIRRWLWVFSKWTIRAICLYLVILLVGLIPTNNDFRPTIDGVEIHIVSNAVHADIILPVTNEFADWRGDFNESHFNSDIAGYSHVAIGWGDKGFFLETPTWGDLKVSTAANAILLPSDSCMHVNFTEPEFYKDASSVKISAAEYQQVVASIRRSFVQDGADRFVPIDGYAYWNTDAFYEANGGYHLFNTCNSWVGRVLYSAGIRVPLYSPMPKTTDLYLR